MISTARTISVFILVSAMTIAISSVAYSANECRIQYGYNTGSVLNGTYKNKSKKIYINFGKIKTINKNRLNYVKNLRKTNVKIYLKNASNVVLEKNQRNPKTLNYVGPTVKLKKVKCLSSITSCNPYFPDVSMTPSPAGPIPIPYPGVKCK